MAVQQTRFKSLSPQWQTFVKRMQLLNFGRFKDLCIVDGEPELFGEGFEIITSYRFPGENNPRPEAFLDDFALPTEMVEFIDTMKDLYMAIVPLVEVRHGLPVHVEVENVE